ncbi:MAG: hypothetical protein KAR42_05465 [candidate division Zixibacteria bacterium]|nr:hypothetical protein [candidate division Zixibacteria bacterium]
MDKMSLKKRSIVLLLFINFILVGFILMRADSDSVPGPRTLNDYTFYKRPQHEAFYPDTLALFDAADRANIPKIAVGGLTSNIHISVGDIDGFCITADQLDTIVIKTADIPGEWSRYDTLYVSLSFDDYYPERISGFIGTLPNDYADLYIKYSTVIDGYAVVSIPLDTFKKAYGMLPLRQPISIVINSRKQISLCLQSIEVSRYERR